MWGGRGSGRRAALPPAALSPFLHTRARASPSAEQRLQLTLLQSSDMGTGKKKANVSNANRVHDFGRLAEDLGLVDESVEGIVLRG